MNTKNTVFNIIKRNPFISAKKITNILKISRQALNKHIKALIEENKISKLGSTKSAKYKIASKKI